jgi:hypothetical protein
METRQRRFSIAYVVLAAIALIVIQSVLHAQQAANLSYSEFKVLRPSAPRQARGAPPEGIRVIGDADS